MEIPIVVDSNVVNIAGFVTSIDLATDVGPQGDRGAIIFSGPAAPTASPSTTPLSSVYGTINQFQSGDLYVKTANPNYGWVYIFQDQPGGGVWTPIVPLSVTGDANTVYAGKHTSTFSSGTTTVSIPMMDILGRDTDLPVADSFIVNVSPQVNSTDTYLVSVKTVTVTPGATLDIVFNGQKISSGGTIALLNAVAADLNLSIGVIA